MRRICLMVSFVALVAALCALWAFRFQRSPGLPAWDLSDLRDATPPIPGIEWNGPAERPSLRVKVGPADPRVAARVAIPGMPAVEMLQLRFRMKASGLTPGAQEWEDGRFMIAWHALDGNSAPANDPVASIRSDDEGGLQSFVITHPHGPAVPALRLEHLGLAGAFEIRDLEIVVVEERRIWKTGRWLLAAGWLAWLTACFRSWSGIPWRRALGASAVWLLMGIFFVFPGPWKIQRPIGVEFQFGHETSGSRTTEPNAMEPRAGNVPRVAASCRLPALGKMPPQGDWALRVKHHVSRARPLLHLLLLFAPTLAISWLAGRKPALWMAGMLAVVIELAQVAFGYGFDRVDVFDLTCDAVGIGLAIRAHDYLKSRGYLTRIFGAS
jgi:hypothetical protein